MGIENRKVISIGVVSELTGLSERKIRYYEDRKLISPERTAKGNRRYSFSDIQLLDKIANKIEDGLQTFEIRKEITKEKNSNRKKQQANMLKGQLNAHFGIRN